MSRDHRDGRIAQVLSTTANFDTSTQPRANHELSRGTQMHSVVLTVSPSQSRVHGRFEEEKIDQCRKQIPRELIRPEWTPVKRLKNILENSQDSMRGAFRITTWFKENAGNGLRIA